MVNNTKLEVARRLLGSRKEIHILDITDRIDKQNGKHRFELSVFDLNERILLIDCFKEQLDERLDSLQYEYLIPDKDILWL